MEGGGCFLCSGGCQNKISGVRHMNRASRETRYASDGGRYQRAVRLKLIRPMHDIRRTDEDGRTPSAADTDVGTHIKCTFTPAAQLLLKPPDPPTGPLRIRQPCRLHTEGLLLRVAGSCLLRAATARTSNTDHNKPNPHYAC